MVSSATASTQAPTTRNFAAQTARRDSDGGQGRAHHPVAVLVPPREDATIARR